MGKALALIDLLIYKSTDSKGDTWDLIHPDDVPMWVQHHETIAHFVEGNGAQHPDEECWWIGIPVNGVVKSRIIGLPGR